MDELKSYPRPEAPNALHLYILPWLGFIGLQGGAQKRQPGM